MSPSRPERRSGAGTINLIDLAVSRKVLATGHPPSYCPAARLSAALRTVDV
jgi:hypothetical protein